MGFLKKIENFWYYYKWYVIVGLFLAMAVVYIGYDAARKPEPDLTICYIGNHASQPGTEESLNEKLAPLLEDGNGDGVKRVEWIELTFDDPDDLQKKQTIEAQVPAIIAAAECKLFLVNESYAATLKELDVFEGEMLPIDGVAAFTEAGVDAVGIYAGVRVAPPKMNDFHRYTQKNAKAVYEMIKNEKRG